jgi:uncharacterized membrane protein
MPNIVSNVRDLCSPALIYLIAAIILMIESLIYEEDDGSGRKENERKNTVHVVNIIIQIVVIVFVTYILNRLCNSGYFKLSWAILIIYIFVYGFNGNIGLSLAV